MFRYSATKRILSHLNQEPVVSNLGPTSDELWHASDRDRNFYTLLVQLKMLDMKLYLTLLLKEKKMVNLNPLMIL